VSDLERELTEALYGMNRALWAITGDDAMYAEATRVRDAIWSLITTVNPERKD
jgi:hypothetical protein